MPKQTFFNLGSDKRDAIIRSALEEFATHSYKEASVNVIVDRACISKGSLYQYFEDKKDLYLHLIACAGQAKLEHLQAHAPIGLDDFFEAFSAMMLLGAKFSLENPVYGKLLYRAFQGPLVDESLASLKAMNREYLTRLLKEAMEKGTVRTDTDIEAMVFLLGVLTMEFAQFISGKEEMPLDEVVGKQEVLKQERIPEAVRELMKLVKTGLAPIAGEKKGE